MKISTVFRADLSRVEKNSFYFDKFSDGVIIELCVQFFGLCFCYNRYNRQDSELVSVAGQLFSGEPFYRNISRREIWIIL
jgi:hypothetical protein